MRKISKSIFSLAISLAFIFSFAVANAEPPMKPPEGDMVDSSSVDHKGANTIASDMNESGKSYSSTESSENAILVSGGTSTLSDVTVVNRVIQMETVLIFMVPMQLF